MGIGGVGSIASMNGMTGLPKTTAGTADTKSKSIQNEIDEKQQQMQKVSSQEELSVDEKSDERKKLQKEISSLNTELERHQDEFLRAQEREAMLAQLRGEAEPAEEKETGGRLQTEEAGLEGAIGKAEYDAVSDRKDGVSEETVPGGSAGTETQQMGPQGAVVFESNDGKVILKDGADQENGLGAEAVQEQTAKAGREVLSEEEADDEEARREAGLSQNEIQGMVSANASAQQAGRQEAVIGGISGDIAVLKGEIEQDEKYGTDTSRKQEELEKLREKEVNARLLQFSVMGEANGAMRSSAETDRTQADAEDNAAVNVARLSQEEQQRFYVSVG